MAIALAGLSLPAAADEIGLARPVEKPCGPSLFAFSRHKITSAHMEPNFVAGRCYRFESFKAGPGRGDVVTFPHNGADHIMRLIGLPGDTVEMRAGRLILNGKPVPTRLYSGQRPDCATETDCAGDWLIETLPGGPSFLTLDLGDTRFDTIAPTTIPEGRVFLLGDNRDNSADSRIPAGAFGMGMIPLDSIQRRAELTK